MKEGEQEVVGADEMPTNPWSVAWGVVLELVSPGLRETLIGVWLDGPTRVEVLAPKLGVTVPATRQHLETLRAAGAIARDPVRTGVGGRPAYLYRLALCLEAAWAVEPPAVRVRRDALALARGESR